MSLIARQQLCRNWQNGMNFNLYTKYHAHTMCIYFYKGEVLNTMISF